MKKKIIIISAFLVIIFFIIYNLTEGPNNIKATYIKDNKEYKDIKLSDVQNIRINTYTEGGFNSKIVSNNDELKKLYNDIFNIKYGEETDMACEDNIECDWIIINKKRYMIVK